MDHIKLTYFRGRGRAETTRWMLAANDCQRRRDFAAVGRSKSAAVTEAGRPPIGGLPACHAFVPKDVLPGLFCLGPSHLGLALGEAVAITVHLKNVDMVGEAVEECTRQAFRSEHRCPLVERQV